MPTPEVKISEVHLPIIGTALTLECNVCVVSYLISQPHVELIGPEDVVLASGTTNGTLHYTLDPVKAWNTGRYMCKAVLEIEQASVLLPFQSTTLFLTVQSKSAS